MLTAKDKAIVMGLSLGDGYIDPRGQFQVTHCEKQKEYAEYKAKLLHSVCGGKDIIVHEKIIDTKGKFTYRKKPYIRRFYKMYTIKKQNKYFKEIREILYPNGKKEFSMRVLQILDLRSIMLWYLDDGCLSSVYSKGKPDGWSCRLFTYTTKAQTQIIADYFESTYNIKWNVVKADGASNDQQWMLRCRTVQARKFLNLIRNLVIQNVPCMSYKVKEI